jgi:hypothetical protein
LAKKPGPAKNLRFLINFRSAKANRVGPKKGQNAFFGFFVIFWRVLKKSPLLGCFYTLANRFVIKKTKPFLYFGGISKTKSLARRKWVFLDFFGHFLSNQIVLTGKHFFGIETVIFGEVDRFDLKPD